MRWTIEELFDLFTSSPTGPIRDPGEGYEDLLHFLNRGWIVAEKCPYEPTAEPEITDPPSGERLTFETAFKRGSGGRPHGMLKWWAWNWLRQCGEPVPQYEAWTAHGRADLRAPTIRYLVECGDTSPGKLLRAFEAQACQVFVLFPFVYEEEYTALLFRVTAEGRVALEVRILEQRARLQELVDDL